MISYAIAIAVFSTVACVLKSFFHVFLSEATSAERARVHASRAVWWSVITTVLLIVNMFV